VRLPLSAPERQGAIFQAYNTLMARLEASEASRLDFLAKVAHNLRSPLGSITGYAALLQNGSRGQGEAAVEEYARIIATQAEHMIQLIERMVTAARIAEGQLDLTPRPMRPGPLLAEVVAEAKRRSGREVAFEDELGAALISGDALRLCDVFAILIDNALKFSAPGTLVEVRLRPAPAQGGAQIRVVDHGIGIAEADLPFLFRRFGFIHDERTRGITGSGLSLYIAKYIVEAHRGRIAVQSQPGLGTTFVVILPLAETAGGDELQREVE
jgi:signal transduction histidine kinase